MSVFNHSLKRLREAAAVRANVTPVWTKDLSLLLFHFDNLANKVSELEAELPDHAQNGTPNV
ncbi:MAG: hypothetical protein ACRD0K_17860 [Egibacteraceae bacterium]